jgi:hypothetical protein
MPVGVKCRLIKSSRLARTTAKVFAQLFRHHQGRGKQSIGGKMDLTGEQFVLFVAICASGLVIVAVALFASIRNQPAIIERMFSEGFFLRMVTVVFIVSAASILALAGKLTSDLSTILAAVAGFVLGEARGQTTAASNDKAKRTVVEKE